MDIGTWQLIVAVVLVSALLIVLSLGAVGGLAQIKARNKGKNPGLDMILDALTPFLYQAIFAGERAILWGFEQADTAVLASDRKKVADAVYDLLPDTLLVAGLLLPISKVKLLLTRDVFEQWVKNVYDQTHAFIQRNETYLKGQVDALKLPTGVVTPGETVTATPVNVSTVTLPTVPDQPGAKG